MRKEQVNKAPAVFGKEDHADRRSIKLNAKEKEQIDGKVKRHSVMGKKISEGGDWVKRGQRCNYG